MYVSKNCSNCLASVVPARRRPGVRGIRRARAGMPPMRPVLSSRAVRGRRADGRAIMDPARPRFNDGSTVVRAGLASLVDNSPSCTRVRAHAARELNTPGHHLGR